MYDVQGMRGLCVKFIQKVEYYLYYNIKLIFILQYKNKNKYQIIENLYYNIKLIYILQY